MMDDFNSIYVEFVKEKDIIKKFNLFLKLHCKEDYAHLIDDDDNAGEFMRQAIQAECNRARLNELDYVDPTATVTVATCGIVSEMTVQERKSELQQLMKGRE